MTNLTNGDICLVEIVQDVYGQERRLFTLAIRDRGLWMWYPDPRIQLGEDQAVVRWVRIADIKGWSDD